MGCTGCSTGDGSPRGCQNNGTCSSGGCNKLGVFDWLANMQLPNNQDPYDIVEIRFKNSRKSFYRNVKKFTLQVGDVVVVEATPGFDVGVVSVVGELARIQVKRKSDEIKASEIKKIYRIANQDDIDKWMKARTLEKEVMYQARTLAVNLNLEMKISDVEYQGDLTKATFYYTADGRVDFRQLIKDMAEKFKIRIEMRQIGSRQEASRLGGIGSCGRELCCSTWLTDFRSVSTSAARYQQLSLNPQKLAGQCGKLKCCLNFELDMYLDAIKSLPSADTKLFTKKGAANHVKTDVFKRLMWFAYEGQAGLIALTSETVQKIIAQNKEKIFPEDLTKFAFEISTTVALAEPDYTNVVGQDSLDRFDDNFKKKKKQSNNNNRLNQVNKPEVKPQNQDRSDNKRKDRPKPSKPSSEQKSTLVVREQKPQNSDGKKSFPKEVVKGNNVSESKSSENKENTQASNNKKRKPFRKPNNNKNGNNSNNNPPVN